MECEIIYKVSQSDLRKVIAEFVTEEQGKVFDRFYNVMVDAKTVANIHGTTARTIIRHVKSGTLAAEPTDGKVYKFRLSEVLKFDFQKVKYQKHGGRTYSRGED
ncbi:hypothetical protein [Geofilum rubicundum]|nr:hypothetical protein [Geofilum rubicundum]